MRNFDNKIGFSESIYQHTAGVMLASAIGAASFLTASRLGIAPSMLGNPKHAIILGSVCAGVSTVGSGKLLYNSAFGEEHRKNDSFRHKIVEERMKNAQHKTRQI